MWEQKKDICATYGARLPLKFTLMIGGREVPSTGLVRDWVRPDDLVVVKFTE
jgi:hypothetical protein